MATSYDIRFIRALVLTLAVDHLGEYQNEHVDFVGDFDEPRIFLKYKKYGLDISDPLKIKTPVGVVEYFFFKEHGSLKIKLKI